MIKEQSFADLLLNISSKSPTPGGGTVAAMAAAVSASLVCMVCSLTIGKNRYRQYEDEMKKILAHAEKLREEFTLLAEKDTEVFNEVIDAFDLPHETEEQKTERKFAVQEATKRASLVPMDVLRRCEALAQLSLAVVSKGNENSISDAGVAAILAYAAAQGASLNILINLSTISDEDFVGKLKTEQARVLKIIKDIVEEAKHIVEEKL